MSVIHVPVAYPEWTESPEKSGLDPLGMQSSSVALYQSLLPGISNVTLRIRYYGFYAWLCQYYAEHIGDTNPTSWQRLIRRSEALFALIAVRHGEEPGIAGSMWATRTLDSSDGEIDFRNDTEPGSDTHYLKQKWGAYGAAYGSQLYEIGIFSSVANHEIPVPSHEVGQALAEYFAEALGPLAERFLEVVQDGRVNFTDLDFLNPFSPSEIAAGSLERQWYSDILFGKTGLSRPNDIERQRTLSLILQVAQQLERIPTVSEVRWFLYENLDHRGREVLSESSSLTEQRTRWWIYQANDLTHIAYETLFKFTLDLLEHYPAGIMLRTLLGEAIDEICSSMEAIPQTWDKLVEQQQDSSPQEERILVEALMKREVSEGLCSPSHAVKALQLLAVLQCRVRANEAIVQEQLSELNNSAFHSLLTEFRFLERMNNESFRTTIQSVLEQRILKRHLWVALRKLRHQKDYTFLIESDEGKIRLRAKDGPVYTNPRLAPAINFLKDIYLIDEDGITDLGRLVLEKR
ncbi:hypothetical protein [Bremerella sp.]|uniref:hypothetical protein n=1 Tax=Bremerella sp. TaxID=2795602 RepID=UPI003918E02E